MAQEIQRTTDDINERDIEDRVVEINRVSKVVKGGRRMRFAALVVVGDKDGHVGFGTGKAAEVPAAINKAIENGKKNLITVPRAGTTIPHTVTGEYDGGKVLLKPAKQGSGVAAGGAVRAVIEMAGISDITSKNIGSNTAISVVRATIQGLLALKSPKEVANLRGKSVEELLS